ncbi:hypothetical protein DAPPUDRAFT_270850 [Daphnia pulex]|uniref:Uncharacterized protein n=1 Tax=Daphnia pulex TaxID=6669 RepID=E9I1E1_DAPPU|nr:hypothetical protein DAPPUDRAFT_270850 [Daphnia pulex]|eukprot:EFX62189.1 hypothetical protein DAPPUDRAFT_270850 [Daphnia pulex]
MTTAVQQKNDRGDGVGRTATQKPSTWDDNGRTATQKTGRVEGIGRTAKREQGNTAAKTGNGTESYQAGDDDQMTAGTMGRLSRSMHHKMLGIKLKHKFYWPTLQQSLH